MEIETSGDGEHRGSPPGGADLQMDSRTAAFDRKRPFNEVADGGNTDGENTRAAKSSKASIFALRSGHAPPVSWNSGAKSKIRTSLGGIRPLIGGSPTQIPSPSAPSIPPPPIPQQLLPKTPEPVIRDSSSEDSVGEDGVILNLEEYKQSDSHGPQPRQTVDPSSYRDTAGAGPDDDSSLDEGEVYSDQEAGTNPDAVGQDTAEGQQTDAMMVYSKSNPEEHDHSADRSDDSAMEWPPPQKLADLHPVDLKAQLKYFYVTRDAKGVDLNDPVSCLTCAKQGHTASVCPSLVCQSCQKVKVHFTLDCPRRQRCEKCRTRGHDKESCTYKLSRLDSSEIECDMCHLTGHTEAECELRWRTSGRPWESDFSSANIAFYCYECGSIGHLGNNCPTRNPGKAMGSSTWSANATRGLLMRGSRSSFGNGIAIKGRAQQKISGDYESEDDLQDFIRPRVPPPTRQGQIRVLGPSIMPKPAVQSGSTTLRSPAGDARRGRRNRRGGDTRNDRDRTGRGDTGHHAPDPVHLGGLSVGDRGDRFKRDHDPAGDSYRPPSFNRRAPSHRPGGRQNVPGASAYRPMPSAAHSAWKKHRT